MSVNTCSHDDAPSMEIGTGQFDFQPIEGGSLEVVPGYQGLFHVWGSARAHAIEPGASGDWGDPSNPLVSFSLVAEDGALLGGYDDIPRVFQPLDDGAFALVGDVVVVDATIEGGLDGVRATFRASLTDACGVALSDEEEVSLVAPALSD